MLAERLPGLLPPLTKEEAMTVSRIHSSAGVAMPASPLQERPPFRAPHHQATIISLVGGGSASPRPGEASLASPRVMKCPWSKDPGHIPEPVRSQVLWDALSQLLRTAARRQARPLVRVRHDPRTRFQNLQRASAQPRTPADRRAEPPP